MKSILVQSSTNTQIKKSLFINYLIPVRNVKHAMKEYHAIKDEHPDANHHCFAYVIGEGQKHQKYSDDGEPNRTAGFPMLDVLLKHDLTDVLTVTVRYFGGVKLGAGGLTRAYTSSVAETIKQAKFAFLHRYDIVQITIPFDEIGHLEHFLHDDYELVHTEYHTGVTYYIEIDHKQYNDFIDFVTDQTNGIAKTNVLASLKRYK